MTQCRAGRPVIDSAIHIWSTGVAPFPWATPPPDNLTSVATTESYIAAAREAGIIGAVIVQPANHMYDHSYVSRALKEHPGFFRGVALANPALPVTDALADLDALKASGFVAVRFNTANFEGGLASEVGKALYKRAGELEMPVGILAFKGLGPHVVALRHLCAEFPATQLVLDHLGFFRQPAIGGLLGSAASNDDESWSGLLSLAEFPQVHVKVSALFRASAEVPPFKDLQPKVSELLSRFGAERLMWGSDFPFVLPGGFPLPEGATQTPAAMTYTEATQVLANWADLDDLARSAMMGETAARVFRFEPSESC